MSWCGGQWWPAWWPRRSPLSTRWSWWRWARSPVGPASSALTFAAAALAAVALQPVRARAGLLADRLVYGRRATPYEVLSDFAGQIAGTYSTEEVLPQMARMVAEATGAERAEVWLRSSGTEHLEAAWPNAAAAPHAPSAPVAAAEPDERTQAFAVEHRGERLGTLRVTCSPREPLTPAGERLVHDVAAQAGPGAAYRGADRGSAGLHGSAWSPRPTRPGEGWNATCTTARSSSWSRCGSRSGWPARCWPAPPTRPPTCSRRPRARPRKR